MTRVFAPGKFQFAVETNLESDRDRVEALFQDVPPRSATGMEPVVFTLRRFDAEGMAWEIDTPRMQGQRTSSFADALSTILVDVNLCALDAEPEHLHLHAAAATTGDGRTVVLAAERDTGKTTTVANLAAAGWRFITDETVRLRADSPEITGFPKPLSIKPGGAAVVEHLEPFLVPAIGEGPEWFRFVSVGASGGQVTDHGTPYLVVLLRRMVGGGTEHVEPVVRGLQPADAVVALMQDTLDAERFGAAALRLAQLAAASHCFELTVGTPEKTVAEIERLALLEPAAHLPVTVLPASDAFRSGVASIAIGDRIVVHDTSTGMVFALDPGGAAVWRRLAGGSVDGDVDFDFDSVTIRPFVDQLRSLGVLVGAA